MKIRAPHGNSREYTDEEVIDIHTRACNYATVHLMSVPAIKERLQMSEGVFRKIIREGNRLTGVEFKATLYRPMRPHGFSKAGKVTGHSGGTRDYRH